MNLIKNRYIDQQLICPKNCHKNNKIIGICMEDSCKAGLRTFCLHCGLIIHGNCNQQLNQYDLIDRLSQLMVTWNSEVYDILRNRDNLSIDDWYNVYGMLKTRVIQTSGEYCKFALSPCGKYLACGNSSFEIRDLSTGEKFGKTFRNTNQVNIIEYSKCGNFIVSGTIKQWSVPSQELFGHPLIGHKNKVIGVSYSKDQRQIISCSLDQTIRVWDQQSGQEYIDKQIHIIYKIRNCSIFVIQNEIIVAFDFRGLIKRWDYRKDQKKASSLYSKFYSINSIKYSNDGKFILIGNDDGKRGWKSICLWDRFRKKQIRQFFAQCFDIWTMNLSPNHQYIISGGSDMSARVWSLATGQRLGKRIRHEYGVFLAQFTICSNYVITGCMDFKITIQPVPQIVTDKYN